MLIPSSDFSHSDWLLMEFPVSSQRGRGWCRPAVSGLRAGLCVAFEGLQFPREAWTALRWASLCVMENPAFPSSWDKTTSTCLREREKQSFIHPPPWLVDVHWSMILINKKLVSVLMCVAVNLCRGGMLSTVLRLLRVDTTLKLSLQSHDTCKWCLGCLFSTMTMSPAQPWVR